MVQLRWLLLMIFLGGCTLTGQRLTPEPLVTPTDIVTGKPSVVISSPENGDEVTVGDDILVSATATDTGGVTRVQMFANDTLVKTVTSLEADGDQTLPVVLDYAARTAGDLTLEVIAYRGSVASDPASVSIAVLEEEVIIQDPIDTNTGPVIDPNDPTCRILTNLNLNYRTGPGTNYDRLGTLVAGTQIPIIGRVGNNSWWRVQVNTFTQAWVSSDFTTEYGNCLNVPVLAPPPTPTSSQVTSTPTRTATPTPSLTPTISRTPRPANLVIADIQGDNTLTLTGSTVSAVYSVLISNAGDAPTGAFSSTITYLPGGDTVELGVVSNLNPGETILLRATLSFTATGQFTVQATADSDDTVDEQSEVDNIGAYIVNVSS